MREVYVDRPEQLSGLCRELKGSEWLAVDTEFMREKTYYPRLCLMQVSGPNIAACIDPFGTDDMSPLVEILYDRSVTKVFHAARQDLEIFFHRWSRLPCPVFDTQLAATLVGLGDQISYAAAVEKVLGRRLNKAQARTDWEQRPLRAEQLRYAFDDVIYLGEMYLMLTQRLRDSGRRSWLDPDFSRLCEVQTYRPDPLEQWRRVRGQQNIKGVRLAVLRELSAWRERLAMQLDKPRRWVLKDEVLVEIARRMPRDGEAMARIRGLDKAALARYGTQLAALVAEAASQPPERWPVCGPPREVPSQEQSALVDMLMAIVRLKANSQNVTPAALASRRDLERLVLGDRDLDVLSGWRSVLVGNDLLAALDGDLWPRLVDGRLRLEGSAAD